MLEHPSALSALSALSAPITLSAPPSSVPSMSECRTKHGRNKILQRGGAGGFF